MTILKEAKDLISKTRDKKSLVLVAIDGCSGSGKTTLASALNQDLNHCQVVHADDFYVPIDLDLLAQLNPEDGFYRHYDWQRIVAELLEPLMAGQKAIYRAYDWEMNVISASPKVVEPQGVVIIEGVYSLFDRLRKFYDISIFVDTSPLVRRQRCLNRAGDEFAAVRDRASTLKPPDFWIDLWMSAEDWYLKSFGPKLYADFIVSGD